MTDAEKREKIIEGLQKCAALHQGFTCESCEYTEGDCAVDDAIAMLKAQEPRVMTLEEVKQLERGALIAYEAKGLELAEDGKNHFVIVCHAAEYNGMDSRGVIWFHGGIGIKGIYGKTVRCWTSRPTDEQREAAPWNG